jgi:phosphopantothenoylcysteine decarboxylase/phosphopantothenate--cysteine ligase
MASGHADNLLIATYLAAKCPVYFAPAMDLDMYKHPSTQKNIKTLIEYGNKLISPREGILASGLSGLGRMEEPEEILKIIISDFQKKKLLKNKKSLVTAGPTCEPLDPVRYIGNHSSGLMGIEIARELYEQGSDVTLVCGPLKYEVPQGIKRIDVLTAEQMYNECCKLFPESDIFVMAAAVADYKPLSPSNNKIKKNENKEFTITLIPTPDILDSLASTKTSNQFVAGFALETDNAIENAITKLDKKNLNLIILNSPGKDTGFGTITNKVTLITDKHKIKDIPLNTKRKIAGDIINEIISFFMNKNL